MLSDFHLARQVTVQSVLCAASAAGYYYTGSYYFVVIGGFSLGMILFLQTFGFRPNPSKRRRSVDAADDPVDLPVRRNAFNQERP